MQRGRRALLHVGHRKPFEDVQRLQQHDAAGRRQRHRDDVVAAIVAAHRRADHGLIRFQIVRRHDAAGIADRLRQLFGDRSFVKSARPLLGDGRKRRREIGLDQPVAFAQRRAVGAGKDLRRIRPARQPAIHVRQRVGDVVGDDEAVARQLDRGLEQICASVNLPEPYFSSASASPATVPGTPMPSAELRDLRRVGLAVGPEKNIARGRGRRGLAIVDGDVFVALGRMDHHEAAAADVAGARIGHGQRKAGRDRGIDRIAALPQDVGADPARRAFPAPPPCRVRPATA